MSETRKIDVIIPTYHPDEKLEKCLRMLKRQTVQLPVSYTHLEYDPE